MRPIIYEDKDGYLHRVLIRDDDPDSMAKYGVPAGPPDVREGIDWNVVIQQINNALVTEGAYSWQDINTSRSTAIQTATGVLKRHLLQLYKQIDTDDKHRDNGV